MDVHKNARLTPKGRELMIERLGRGEHPIDVAGAVGVSDRTVHKWHKRYREGGLAALRDRSSRPRHSPPQTSAAGLALVLALAATILWLIPKVLNIDS